MPGGAGEYKGHLYLCAPQSSTLYKIDPESSQVVDSYSLETSLDTCTLTFFQDKMAAISFMSGSMIGDKLQFFDAETMNLIKSHTLPAVSTSDQIIPSPDGSRLYLSRGSMNGPAFITIYDGTSLDEVTTITIPNDPSVTSGRGSTGFVDYYFDEEARQLYMTGFSGVYIIDMDTDALVAIWDLDDITALLGREFAWTPTGLAGLTVSPAKDKLMVVAGDSNLMYTYDLISSQWTTELLNIKGFWPTDAAVSPDRSYFYTINCRSDNVSVIDAVTRSIVRVIDLP